MDQFLQNIVKFDTNVSNKKDLPSSEIVILHHNIQSLSNKLLELDILLQSDLTDVNILCFTEHWLKEDKLKLTNISHFDLVSNFSRIRNGRRGPCIYVREYLQTKKVNCVQGLSKEKEFELSIVELVDYKFILVCIYRSPDGDFRTFLNKLELVIHKVHSLNKKLILCGDWNINFMKHSDRLQELINLLVMYSLINTVISPTKITKNPISLLDVIVTNKQTNEILATVLDLGYSDHLAQILHIKVDRHKQGLVQTRKRLFTKENIEEFKCLLQNELWQETFSNSDVSTTFNACMDTIHHHFDEAFPLKTVYLSNLMRKKWITQGIRTSSKKT
jgi:exonuclease III